MSVASDLTERLRTLLFRRREERELQEEVEFHLHLETEKNLRAGMTPAEARRRARLAFGGTARIGEEVRDARGTRPLEDIARDLRHAARSLARRPGFTLVAVVTLALGIGASTAMFSLVNSVLLRPLAYAAPDRLVALGELAPGATELNPTSPRTVTAWRRQATAFDGITAFTDRLTTLRGEDDATEVRVRLATDD